MKIILDGKQMQERSSAHEYLKKMLEFPEYYGANLDALYDLLTEMGDETTIILKDSSAVKESLGDYGQSMIDTFTDAAAENAFLTVDIN